MKAAQFNRLDGVSTILHDLEHLKTVEKGIKDVTTELLLHLSSRTGDNDMTPDDNDRDTDKEITLQDDSNPPVNRNKKPTKVPPRSYVWSDFRHTRMQDMHVRLL